MIFLTRPTQREQLQMTHSDWIKLNKFPRAQRVGLSLNSSSHLNLKVQRNYSNSLVFRMHHFLINFQEWKKRHHIDQRRRKHVYIAQHIGQEQETSIIDYCFMPISRLTSADTQPADYPKRKINIFNCL